MSSPRWLFLSAMLVAFSAQIAAAQEWTRFRGPNGSGEIECDSIPITWTESDYNWRLALPGVGHSSPVIWGERVFITSGDPASGDVLLLCIDTESGQQLWEKRFATAIQKLHLRNSYASATPCVDEQCVYLPLVTPDSYRVVAIDHAGHPRWEVDLGPFKSEHGFGSSPILHEELLVLASEQDGASSLVALDRRTGKQVWTTPRKTERAAYSTPCVYTPEAGPPQLIFNSSAHGISGIDPQGGRTLWEIQVFDKRSVSSPIVAGGLVFGSCGSGGGGNYTVAVRPGDGDRAPEIAYKIAKSANYVPTAVAHGDLVFLWYDRGVASCIDARTGEIHWQERVEGNYSGSPVRVGDRLYCISDSGDVVVLSATKTFKLLARTPLGEPSRTTPAISSGRLYLRTEKTLFSLGQPKG